MVVRDFEDAAFAFLRIVSRFFKKLFKKMLCFGFFELGPVNSIF